MHDGARFWSIAMAVVEPFHLICKLITDRLRVQTLVLYDMREWTTQWKRLMLFNCFLTT